MYIYIYILYNMYMYIYAIFIQNLKYLEQNPSCQIFRLLLLLSSLLFFQRSLIIIIAPMQNVEYEYSTFCVHV